MRLTDQSKLNFYSKTRIHNHFITIINQNIHNLDAKRDLIKPYVLAPVRFIPLPNCGIFNNGQAIIQPSTRVCLSKRDFGKLSNYLLLADVPDSPLFKGPSKAKRFRSPASPSNQDCRTLLHTKDQNTHEHPDVIQICSRTNRNGFRKILGQHLKNIKNELSNTYIHLYFKYFLVRKYWSEKIAIFIIIYLCTFDAMPNSHKLLIFLF
ncbi:hypothetical protein EGR_10583 [Echinococcus granulosus]|uniref:Uncharacterized protein n=1 Tax=Echinococcus granulosus TaxID=6210 RepID=W6U830_ECHGR|nr:hypothetical protein EGR_10583 [Echinococcus granulosus]EUB54557.1 hypothetical protein EGR_10583 [Echinococcus granulosus]